MWRSIKDSIPSDHDKRPRIPVVIYTTNTDHRVLAKFSNIYQTYYDFTCQRMDKNFNGLNSDQMIEEGWNYYFIIPEDEEKEIY